MLPRVWEGRGGWCYTESGRGGEGGVTLRVGGEGRVVLPGTERGGRLVLH